MIILTTLETVFLYFVGVYGANQVWNLFAKNKNQQQILQDTFYWTVLLIMFDQIDKFFGV